MIRQNVDVFLPERIGPFQFLGMEQIVPVQFGENSGSVLRVQFFQFCQSRLIESADAGLGNRFQQLNQRVPPLLVSELFRQIVCQGLLRVECFRRFFVSCMTWAGLA